MRVQDQTYQAPSFKSKKAYDVFKAETTSPKTSQLYEKQSPSQKKQSLKGNKKMRPTGNKNNQISSWSWKKILVKRKN